MDLLDSGNPQLARQSKKDAVQKPIGLVLLAVAASVSPLFWTHYSAACTVRPRLRCRTVWRNGSL
jgi:hypothetical protein